MAVSVQKFELELQGHEPHIDKVLGTGDALLKRHHFAAPAIQTKKQEVTDAWQTLLKHSANRRKNLDNSLKKHKVHLKHCTCIGDSLLSLLYRKSMSL